MSIKILQKCTDHTLSLVIPAYTAKIQGRQPHENPERSKSDPGSTIFDQILFLVSKKLPKFRFWQVTWEFFGRWNLRKKRLCDFLKTEKNNLLCRRVILVTWKPLSARSFSAKFNAVNSLTQAIHKGKSLHKFFSAEWSIYISVLFSELFC